MKMLLKQDYVASRLNSSLRNLYVCYRDLVDRNEHIFLNWQLIFALFLRFFFPLSPTERLLDLSMSKMVGVL